ncbi:MAG: hypothetical protein HYZ28_05505 [Myxococcales bacterium]|nr:hypothetical protein [Myxococcales bacterium]
MKAPWRALTAAAALASSLAFAQAPAQQPYRPQAQPPMGGQMLCPCPMMGMQGGMGGAGMMGGGMMAGQCPMAAGAEVKVENTKEGAILRLNAKDPKDLQQVQSMAKMLGQCLGAQAPAAQ